tara:strand:+ start:120 stop:1073 length:954 start_codon:yes stop_codon:yes gene_type:complete
MLRVACQTACRTASLRSAVATAASLHTDATVAVVGLGSMGHGIVQLAATSGYKVIGVETSAEALTHGLDAISASLEKLASKGKITEEEKDATLGRISGTTSLEDVGDADLVIEAIIEDMAVKVPFYESLGKIAKADAILATNTSSYSVNEIADASGVPSRVCGLHYFNPVQLMKLVEVVSTERTDPAITETMMAFAKQTGKVPVKCGDTPGFVVNRLLVPYIGQAVALLARGDASAEDIDTAMQLGAGHPMGPITLADYVGLDVNLAVLEGWGSNFPDDPSYVMPEAMELLREKVAAGDLGRKTGQGFYKWKGNKKA